MYLIEELGQLRTWGSFLRADFHFVPIIDLSTVERVRRDIYLLGIHLKHMRIKGKTGLSGPEKQWSDGYLLKRVYKLITFKLDVK